MTSEQGTENAETPDLAHAGGETAEQVQQESNQSDQSQSKVDVSASEKGGASMEDSGEPVITFWQAVGNFSIAIHASMN